MDEISVLDYLKFKLNPKNFGKEILPRENPADEEAETDGGGMPAEQTLPQKLLPERGFVGITLNPLFLIIALCLALAAQIIMEPTIIARTHMTPWIGGGLYLAAALCFCAAFFLRKRDEEPRGEMPQVMAAADASVEEASEAVEQEDSPEPDASLPDVASEIAPEPKFRTDVRLEFLFLSMLCALLSFLLFGGNRFTFLNVSVWCLSFVFAGLAFSSFSFREIAAKTGARFRSLQERGMKVNFSFSAWNLLWLAVFACCAFFLFYKLNDVPVDMVSDHAEKLYDIKDILDGKRPIFFTRNTGRECFQFYFTVLVIKIFGTGLSFLSLKIGTALAGLFILPFVYKLGKMLGNRWIGLLAMLLAGISYWPIVIGRAALRFAYYPMFTAPALYFLIKGFRNRSRGSLIWCGIFTGIGLHGYSPFRIVPIVLVVFFVVFLLMEVKPGRRINALLAFLSLVFFAFLVFLPLARVTVDMPEMVVYRSVSRLGESEKSFDDSPIVIFADNVRKGIVMPFWDDGTTWVHSIVHRPALENLSASFFFLGLLFVLLRIIRQRSWADICLILSIPLLMLPSTLSLAFPGENPCLNRTAGALIPVMLITAAGFCCTIDVLAQALKNRTAAFAALSVVTVLFLVNILTHNYDLIFGRFAYDYNHSAWNTKQIGEVIKGFADSVGTYETSYVIPYPHWVDTRLVGINAGIPGKDYSFDKSRVRSLPDDGLPRLFIYRDTDTEAAETIRERFPNGVEQLHTGPYEGKDFYSYIAFSSPVTGGN